ncbi:hypothetical protein [Blastopirellula marina]|uniref:Uncharacterized protein n=1 Tax=Blastopirellula marina TaxID=124 RepID=A0A2S8G184_9BACT|nr:hypothetical protein [Blastopirellula marina]PQO38196.1 hypothetical protein C5Y98_08995 [Blastopirellula marina]PTL44852.1 hypothetical protein C5Y97_09000 [Blastopirellula marina]
MKRFIQLNFVLLILFFVGSATLGQTPLAAPYEGVLVLTNGNAMKGRITHEGEFYVLAINENSVIRMPAERVSFACKTMEEAYLRQKASVGTTTLRDHVELANWCLNLEMWDEATYHYTIALRSGPNDPDVIRLDRRYQVKLEERNNPQMVKPVHFTQPVPATESRDMEMPQPVSDEHDPALSPKVIQYYASTVQPIMLNSCAVSACHNVNADNGFRIVQFENVRMMPRRLTIRNMNTSVDFVDFANPTKSKLLLKSAERHGEGGLPNLSPEQITAIQAWVVGVARSGKPVRRPAESGVMPVSYNAPVEGEMGTENVNVPVALQGVGSANAPSMNPIFGGSIGTSSSTAPRPFRSMPQKGAELPEMPKVRDEFDPELFNRQFHPNYQAPLFPE